MLGNQSVASTSSREFTPLVLVLVWGKWFPNDKFRAICYASCIIVRQLSVEWFIAILYVWWYLLWVCCHVHSYFVRLVNVTWIRMMHAMCGLWVMYTISMWCRCHISWDVYYLVLSIMVTYMTRVSQHLSIRFVYCMSDIYIWTSMWRICVTQMCMLGLVWVFY